MKQLIVFGVLGWMVAGCERAPERSFAAVPSCPVPPSATATQEKATEPLSQALILYEARKLSEARTLLQSLIESTNVPPRALDVLGKIDMEILMSPVPSPEKVDYTIVESDSLGKIAKQFGTTIELVKASNRLSRDTVRTGDRLRIYRGEFSLDISKTRCTLTLSDRGKFFKQYAVGTGQYSKTPVGEFKITNRMVHPPWWRADGQTIPFGDPENVLGTHWLGLNTPGYGIHGTWDTNSIGRQATAGCIRLLNSDVEELYTILPVGTPVVIHE